MSVMLRTKKMIWNECHVVFQNDVRMSPSLAFASQVTDPPRRRLTFDETSGD